MRVDLNGAKTITIVPAQTKTLSSLTIDRVVDLQGDKKVFAIINELYEPVDLWVGADYDAVGQWTDTDVANRIREIFAWYKEVIRNMS